MSEHTKEPWRLGRYPDDEIHGKEYVVVDLPENRKYVLFTCNMNFPDDAKANARRIVACVNACAGIPTETLEKAASSVPVKSSLNGYLEMKKQRDELLAAAKAIRPFIEDDAIPVEFWAGPFMEAVIKFDAAIEKAK